MDSGLGKEALSSVNVTSARFSRLRESLPAKMISSIFPPRSERRISVDFVKGVTAVVGPNGSGKSNITEAIRWVLGDADFVVIDREKMIFIIKR
jgi:AAA15 family ATPase/GTPase